MPRQKINEVQLLDKLTHVFRLYGYEGASLTRLTEATGLKRASLYHHFPGGKEEMALAVLERGSQGLEAQVLTPLQEPGTPAQRVQHMAERLNKFYAQGQQSCLLDTLSLGEEDSLHKPIQKAIAAWLKAMIQVAQEAGLAPDVAEQRAEEVLIRIQGSLVFARTTGNTQPFQRVLKELPSLLTTDRE